MKLRECDIVQLMCDIVEGDRCVVCIGAGGSLEHICNTHEGFYKKIAYILDNRVNEFIYRGERTQVYRPETFFVKNKKVEPVYFLITSANYYHELAYQLENEYAEVQKEFYIYEFIRKNSQYEAEKLIEDREMYIPKLIHYCWFGGAQLPEKNKKYIESWHKNNPDYRIIEWNEQNYDVNAHEYTKAAYREKEYAFLSDYARLDIVNKHGGIYFDTDVRVIRNLDELLYNRVFFGIETTMGIVANGVGFGAERNNRLIKEMLKYYDEIEIYTEEGEFNKYVHVEIVMQTLERYGLAREDRYQKLDEGVVYPSEVFNPLKWGDNYATTKNTISIHEHEKSWAIARSKEELEEIEVRAKNKLLSR